MKKYEKDLTQMNLDLTQTKDDLKKANEELKKIVPALVSPLIDFKMTASMTPTELSTHYNYYKKKAELNNGDLAETIALLNLKLNRANNVVKLLETIGHTLGFSSPTGSHHLRSLLIAMNAEQARYVQLGSDPLRPDLSQPNIVLIKTLTDKDLSNPGQVLPILVRVTTSFWNVIRADNKVYEQGWVGTFPGK